MRISTNDVSRRIDEIIDTLPACLARLKRARAAKEVVALGFHGNIVALWEALAAEPELLVELGSDQTSCHNPFNGGYYPVQLPFADAQRVMAADPAEFKRLVQESLRRQVAAINALCARGMRFFDYGNAFMLEAGRASADIFAGGASAGGAFRYPTYIQEFMGDIFSLGFGPFRWVCTSGAAEDLRRTDHLAADVIRRLRAGSLGACAAQSASDGASDVASASASASASGLVPAPARVDEQLADNLLWIEQAESHRMVVGSQARILYADAAGRVEIAVAINRAIRDGHVSVRVRCAQLPPSAMCICVCCSVPVSVLSAFHFPLLLSPTRVNSHILKHTSDSHPIHPPAAFHTSTSGAGGAVARPPRRVGHRFAVPRDQQCDGRLHVHRRHGRAERDRRLVPRRHLGRAAQWVRVPRDFILTVLRSCVAYIESK